MGTRFTAHTAMEVSIGDSVIEFCVDLECMLHAGSKRTFDDPGDPGSVEIISVGEMWEDELEVTPDGKLKKVRKVHGVPSAWFQQLIIDHVDMDSLIEQAPEYDD